MLDFIVNVAQHVQVTLAYGPASFHFRSMDCARERIMQQVMETVLHAAVYISIIYIGYRFVDDRKMEIISDIY